MSTATSWGADDVTVTCGAAVALDGVSVDVPPGAVSAVVGGDGADKSTLLKVVAGVITADRGRVRRPAPGAVGVMAEVPGVWHDLTVDEHVAFAGDAYGLTRGDTDQRAQRLLVRAELSGAGARLAGALSGGMRQKLAVVLALLHQPALLVLDEPTTGVDPLSRAQLWRLIGHAAAEGTAVLLATTYLEEADRAADVLVLHAGRALLRGEPRALTGQRSLEELVIERQHDAETLVGGEARP